MGLNVQALRLLLHARSKGANLDRVVTIGRLDALLTPDQLEQECAAFGEQLARGEAERLIYARDRFCEPIIERLGATRVDSVDASDFEGATVVHDLNKPLPEGLHRRYSLLLDGGTLENVFNFPEALKSCMSMVEVGGHALFCLPSNNQMGHGFYQFSPELFFRAFSEENGYRLNGLYLAPIYGSGDWLKIEDPATVGERVGYNQPIDEMGLYVFAERVSDVQPFANAPQQSDYVAEWQDGDRNRLAFFDRGKPPRQSRLKRLIPEPALKLRRVLLAGKHATSGPDPRKFLPFDPRSAD